MQGGHDSPGRHAGQAQVQVPPPSSPQVGGGGWQSHPHGGHASPGAQAGQVQEQVPPPPPPLPVGGGGQSQAQGGQSSPAGQASGQAHTQPSSGRAVQKPPLEQSAPTRHKVTVLGSAHMQPGSASQLGSSPCP
jgi:hypothetical protein